jgi:hypothetical protein
MHVWGKGYGALESPELLHGLLSYAFDDDFSSVIIGGVLHFGFLMFVASTVVAVRSNNASWIN